MKNNYCLQKTKQKNAGFKSVFFAALALLFLWQHANAQLAGWAYRDGITVHENAGTQKLNYQVLLNINTAALVSASKMQASGNDMRFSKDCAGATLLNYFIESGMNTANTQVWVELDTLAANGNYLLYMWYGNTTAAAASNFNNTFPLSTQLVVPSGTVTLTGTNNYSWFEIQSGAVVTIGPNSPFVITARMIRITGTLNGNGSGSLGGTPSSNGSGTGGGKTSLGNLGTFGGGGGSYGGRGGRGEATTATAYSQKGLPGLTYGTMSTDSIDMGSGGAGAASAGGAGGAGISLTADVIDISGTVNANGSDGTLASLNGGGGGGSGGGIKIKGNKVSVTGILTVKGGAGGGGGYAGAGGGGGRIKIFSDASVINTSVTSVTGGAIGNPPTAGDSTAFPGAAGTTATGTWASKVPTYSFVPHVVLSSSNTTFCHGSIATFTASAGFGGYNFYVNTTSAQNSASNTFSSTTLANNNVIKVLAADAKGCADTSNKITVTVNPLPVIGMTPTSATMCTGGSVNLTANGANTYTWSPGTGLNTTSGASVTAGPGATTTYTVMGSDANGCMNSDTVTVAVMGCTGLQQAANSAVLNLYPNPGNGIFVIEINATTDKNVVLELNNMLGETVRVIENRNITGSYRKEVSLQDLSDGVYFLNLTSGNTSITRKLIKNRDN
ncbi:MAG TPA: DUF2341 domain-containing protein [Bacteroidia bacterium]|nr:DUF2341 domain-containing protein [Bacteroidia bacterium]